MENSLKEIAQENIEELKNEINNIKVKENKKTNKKSNKITQG